MQRLIALIVCGLLATPTFITALDVSGIEEAIDYSGSISQADATLLIGTNLSGLPDSHLLTYTMAPGGNDEHGFTLTFESDYVFNHDGDDGNITVVHSKIANGHNQPFQVSVGNLIDSGNNTIGTASSTSAFGTAKDADEDLDETTITFNEPQRAVRDTDVVKLGLHTSANTDLISGTYVAAITVTIATLE